VLPGSRSGSRSRCTARGAAGLCDRCRVGVDMYCEDLAGAPVPGGGGLGLDGGMVEYMLVPDARHLVPLPGGLSPMAAAPLTVAGLTPYHAAPRSGSKLGPRSTVLVIGIGGLGHVGVQILHGTTAARVIAVDTRTQALALAERCGADVTVPAGDDAAGRVREETGGTAPTWCWTSWVPMMRRSPSAPSSGRPDGRAVVVP
jgi:alcohol dehydrogenase, propanol-preferring